MSDTETKLTQLAGSRQETCTKLDGQTILDQSYDARVCVGLQVQCVHVNGVFKFEQ